MILLRRPRPLHHGLMNLRPFVTLARGTFMLLRRLAMQFRHWICGKPVQSEHAEEHNDEQVKEKEFSDVPLDADIEEYCKVIPGYKDLLTLQAMNFEILKGLNKDQKEVIWKLLPSFLVIAGPKTIREYREDYMNAKECSGDYAEILFSFGNELVYLWDFDRKKWYVQDRTYSPHKEWTFPNEYLLGAIAEAFNPDKNELLRHRVGRGNDKAPEEWTKFAESYCKLLLNLIQDVRDGKV